MSFDLTYQGTKPGKLRSAGTRQKQFDITDAAGNDVGRYVLELTARLPQPLATLVVVAPLAIDLAFNVNQAGYRALHR
ncbi:hypothetical protein [Amycolatopsis jiangsuensis]|uniref:Uncharacterized protein n=1 Tax=Amycolatopsis jiangsuensis TaxID=1181879 RepID=A0A840J0K0_9PSEU|nr:hypothetical protein [Amycolatopsis jiangsuensis]MBB4686928.1 hypothetical protein [Amycolatopsis jiangsuensis]